MNRSKLHYSDLPLGLLSKPENLLKFAIYFCQEDLGKIRPGDLMNLREDLGYFMYGHPESEVIRTIANIRAFDDFTLTGAPVDQLIEIQKEVYEVLNCAASWGKKINPKSVIKHGAPIPRHHISVDLDLRQDKIGVHGTSKDCLLFILYHLLAKESGTVKRIAVCPGCGRIFYRVKRQKYCSQRCSNRVYMQQYRSTENGRGAVSDANHVQYKKRTKKQTGISVKIARNPRRK